MRILDAFCCAGGAAMGYHQAGFEVTGADTQRDNIGVFQLLS
jgi:DNA (cytosine-5)-methyltransferase 1